jgi:hypothetical protein
MRAVSLFFNLFSVKMESDNVSSDIVDCHPWNGQFHQVVLGSIDPQFDDMNSPSDGSSAQGLKLTPPSSADHSINSHTDVRPPQRQSYPAEASAQGTEKGHSRNISEPPWTGAKGSRSGKAPARGKW